MQKGQNLNVSEDDCQPMCQRLQGKVKILTILRWEIPDSVMRHEDGAMWSDKEGKYRISFLYLAIPLAIKWSQVPS